MAFKDDIKPYFRDEQYPNEDQFAEAFDKQRWKDEPIPMADIIGLVDALNTATGIMPDKVVSAIGVIEYTIPTGWRLESVILEPSVDTFPYMGTADGGTYDIMPLDLDNPVTAADGVTWEVSVYAKNAPIVVTIGNMPVTSEAYFIKRKIK
jgi:hypothetical protein